MFFVLVGNSQNKIGELTVDAATFTKYLLDCYNRPDTLSERSFYDYIEMNQPTHQSTIDRFKQISMDYNTELQKSAIKKLKYECCSERYVVPRKPTEADFIKWLKRNKQ